ncbi:unnamed protein product [Closterium sp. Naga37s-1]|nr:unnamed protein product [Closterium sp. Naga37s-1]
MGFSQAQRSSSVPGKRGGSAVEFSAVRLLVEERDAIALPLPKDGEAVASPASFELKERCKYRLQFEFTVANDVVLGLTYVNTVYKDGDQGVALPRRCASPAPRALSLLSSTSTVAPHFPRSTRPILTRADPKGDARELWRREIEADSAAATDFDAVDADTVREEAQRLTRKQVMERLDKASYQELRALQESGYDSDGGSTRPGGGGKNAESGGVAWKEVVDKILVADFFLITIALVWFLTGVLQRSISHDDGLLLAWLKLWDPLFQPAIGVFMGSAVLQAVLKKRN